MTSNEQKWAQRGIAIGPILFVIAIMAVIASVMAAGMGSFSSNASVDRIRADIRGQANLIRSKIQECYMVTMGAESFGYPTGASGVDVRDAECPGDPTGRKNLWSGARPSSLPPPVPGFNEWVYYNYAGGRCIMATPTAGGSTDASTKDGINVVSAMFNANEVHIDTSGDWSLSIWLTPHDSPGKCGE